MFDKNERATALLALRSSASSTSSPMYSPECNVSTCAQRRAAISMRLTYHDHMHAFINAVCRRDTDGRMQSTTVS